MEQHVWVNTYGTWRQVSKDTPPVALARVATEHLADASGGVCLVHMRLVPEDAAALAHAFQDAGWLVEVSDQLRRYAVHNQWADFAVWRLSGGEGDTPTAPLHLIPGPFKVAVETLTVQDVPLEEATP